MNIKQNVHSKNFTEEDARWMKVAINYARHGVGLTSKNPSVGCVIVKNNQLIGVGRTSNGGRPHAEENALNMAGKNSNGAFLYVTLEPCHMCSKAIVDARIKNLFIGALEPKSGSVVSVDNFLDAKFLNHKVNYESGFLDKESASLLKSFFRSRRDK